MKKTGRIICLILTIFVCAFFSACKVNYDKLTMSFYSVKGEQIEQVRLVINETKTDNLAQTKIAIQFDGVKSKYIGDVLVYSMPNDLVNISNENLEDNKYFVTLQATSAGVGKIYVKHLTSGKTSSIKLIVDKKTTTVTNNVNEYVVAIPQDEQLLDFDIDTLVSQDGTDNIAFKLATDSSLPTGAEAVFDEFNKTKVMTGLKLTNKIKHGSSVGLYPISFMDGYETINEYPTSKIKITFIKVLTDNSFILDTDDLHKEEGYLNLNKPFHLIAKDIDMATGGNYQFNNINFDLKYTDNNQTKDLMTDTSFGYLQKYYDVNWVVPEDFKNLIEVFFNEHGQVVIEAKDYSNTVANIQICLTPKVVGNLKTVSKTVLIKCDVKPIEYEITVQGKLQQTTGTKNTYNIDLYDYYRATDSAYGANFTFKPIFEYSYADLKNIKIKLNPAILDVKTDSEGVNPKGVNVLHNLDKLTTPYANNKYLLQFYIDGKPIEFDVDEDGFAISNGIIYQENLQRVQIKYTEITDNEDLEPLTCVVQNYYSGELEYLKSIKSTEATIQFNHKEGIKEVTVYAGILTKGVGTTEDSVETLVNESGTQINVENVYLNRVDTKSYVFYATNLRGDKNKVISKANINIKVSSNYTNSLKLLQNQANDDGSTAQTEINYAYLDSVSIPFNSVVLKLDSNTDVGYYRIDFIYADEIIYTFNCLVYEQLRTEQIEVQVQGNQDLIVNKQGETYIYQSYSADYIVKANANEYVTVALNLPEQFTTDYVAGYNFDLTICDEGGTPVGSVNEFAKQIIFGNQINISFLKGSIVENKIAYIKLAMKVEIQEFTNILTRGSIAESETKYINFFVYEQITKDDIQLNKTNINGYWDTLLSPYYKEDNNNLSKADLQIILSNNYLWNYVQPQTPDVANNKIGSQLVKIDSNATYSNSETYYLSDGTEIAPNSENHNNEYFDQNKSKLYIKTAKVVWYTDEEHILSIEQQSQNGIILKFVGTTGSASIDVFAQIKQFNLPEITLKCHIEITSPVITDKLYITSETKQITGNEGKRVISLKAGQEYELMVDYYSNQFERLPTNERVITNPGFVMLVVDKAGNIHDTVVSVEGNKLKVKDDFTLTTDLRLIVFARDALKEKLQDVSGYTDENLANYLMEDHSTAFVTIDLIVSNGSKQSPYSIFDEQDFNEIYQTDLAKTKYYRLMSNIYLSAIAPISNFSGGIDTYNNATFYTIYGVKLNDNVPNLFTNFTGTMQNINFDVKYSYKGITSTNLGVFGTVEAGAKLTNVSVSAYGADVIIIGNENNYINFGGLVGLNKGKIEYTVESVVGANVDIDISANYSYFGGLVGLNQGTITGCTKSSTTSSEIVFSTFVENEGATVSVNISAIGFASGAVGGVIGKNTNSLTNIYACGKILSKQSTESTLNNVGGVIGWNEFVARNVFVELDGAKVIALTYENEQESQSLPNVLTNVKSSVQINAYDNIGGITGVDKNGIYLNCKYQILAGFKYGLNGHDNIGGIIGNSADSMLEYCSVYSYRWDYNNLNDIVETDGISADIIANSTLGGLIGYASSSATDIQAGNLNIVAIKTSSVNAFIKSEQTNAFVGQSNAPVILDSYYYGNIMTGEGLTVDYAQNANANFVYIFATNLKIKSAETTGTAVIVDVKDTIEITKTIGYEVKNRTDWKFNASINGGSSYLEYEGKPIFEVAPTSLTLTLKDTAKNDYGVFDNYGTCINGLVHLDLYDFNLDANSKDYGKNYQLQTEKNTYLIKDIFDITAEPKDLLSEVRLSAKASDTSVVMISNGSFIARGAGQATITFTSVLNNAIKTSVIVDVGKPFGDTVSLYLSRDNLTILGSENEPAEPKTIALTKGEALLFNYLSSGFDAGYNFNYITNEQTGLLVKVEVASGSLPEGKSINNYLNVSGKAISLDKNGIDDVLTKGSIAVSYNTPFSIKAIEKIENVIFKFTVTPYIEISGYKKESKKTIVFNIKTTSGVTDISLSSENLILYPNDTTIITAYLTTDRKIQSLEAINLINDIQLNDKLITTASSDFGTIFDYVSVITCGEIIDKTQIVKFSLTIPSTIKDKLISNISNTMIVNFKAGAGIGNGAQDSLQLTLLKQRIDELVVRNFIYGRKQDGSFDYSIYTQNSTLRPVGEGLITIDIAPSNGNYDYIEISDITGTEEIVFIQTRGIHGSRILDNVQPSADGKGIRLKSIEGECTYYIATMIDANYTNRKHMVKISAYVDGTIIKSTTMEIDVKMLPEVNIYLVDNDGSVDRTSFGTQYLAQGTKVRFKVETHNSDDVAPQLEITGATYTDYQVEEGGYYSLVLGANTAGQKLTVSATTQLTLNNGNVETSTENRQFNIENFVVNNVSVSHSTTNKVNGVEVTKIYGNLRANVPIEFYFQNGDLNFVANDYEYSLETYSKYKNDERPADSTEDIKTYAIKHAIYQLLDGVNGLNAFEYLDFDLSRIREDVENYQIQTDGNVKKVIYTKDGVSNDIAVLTFAEDSIQIKLNERVDVDMVLTLPLKLVEHNFVLANTDATLTKKFTYQLDFIEETSFIEPIAVRSVEDFVNMTGGGDYILAKDLTLDAYTPIDVNVNSFDGNGHKITINSFDLFNEASIQAGLFKQIYENMVVVNLVVNYNLGRESTGYYYDLCNDTSNTDYTDAHFGGITAVNYGIISNCKVMGKVTLSASSVEQKASNDEILFNIAGMVCNNNTTGRITNSVSELQITAKANIAGVVCENRGKIASTCFDATNDGSTVKGKIYAYNNNITVPYSIKVAGFALENVSGAEISMSFVEATTHEKSGNTIGNISAKDYSAGFVFTNAGSVYDCYDDIELIGESSHNHIAGFVYENTGDVENCYSYINQGRKTNLISMFTLENTVGISNCYEVKQDVAGYKNNVDGLTTISVLNRTNKDSYPSFKFGDNVSAVWTKTNSGMPKLVANQQKVEFTGSALSSTEEGKEYPSYYYGLKDLQLIKTEIKNENGVVINVEYKYKTLANNFGDKQNPILIYNLATWDYYLGQTDVANSYYNNTKYYYRVINDVDFSSVYNNPTTSTISFNGNLQGNNMDLAGFRIYSSQNLDSIGLFADLTSLNNKTIQSTISNLDLLPTSVSATRTQAVGVLAGVSDNYNLYNIDIQADNVTIVGGNAVGGVAGLVRGKFDIDGASSNVGVYSSRSQKENNYSIFTSKYLAGKFNSSNLSSVYYAGAVFGILDSLNGESKTGLNTNNETALQLARHLSSTGSLTLYGDTVGGLVGLVGKNVKLNYVQASINNGNFAGYQYSAGLVGENRGIITNAKVSLTGEELFKNSTYVSAGLVGFNLNGLVDNVSVYAEINKTNQSVVGGIVGRNLNGYVQNATVDGKLNGYYVGGIVGADYGLDMFISKSVAGGGGAIKISEDALTKLQQTSYAGLSTVKPFANMAISKSCVENWINNLTNYYAFGQGKDYTVSLSAKKVLGLAVGLTNKGSYDFNYGYDGTKNYQFVINGTKDIDAVGCVADNTIHQSITNYFGLMNIINSFDLPKDFKPNYAVMYVVGANIETFDFWLTKTGYSNECFVFSKSASYLTVNPKVVIYIRKTEGELFNMKAIDKYKIITSSEENITFAGIDLKSILIDAKQDSETEQYSYELVYDSNNKSLSIKENITEVSNS